MNSELAFQNYQLHPGKISQNNNDILRDNYTNQPAQDYYEYNQVSDKELQV